jgi:Tol biopolymer transport system component
MLSIYSSQEKLIRMIPFVCLAVALLVRIGIPKVDSAELPFANSAAQVTPAAAASTSKMNGKIVFSSDRQRNNNFTIWTMNADGSNPTRLTDIPTSSSYVYDFAPKWSPDGTKIAFCSYGRGSSHSLFVMNADGADLHEIVINSSPEIGSFEWSPDGAKFLFDAGSYVELYSSSLASDRVRPAGVQANIYIADIDGKNLTRLTNDTELMNGSASWSPDGRLIAFQSRPSYGPDPIKIYVMSSDGTNRHLVATGSGPSWAPDGTRIVFVGAGSADGCYNKLCQQLYTIKTDGSELTQLTHYADSYILPRYSSDGSNILFSRELTTSYVTNGYPFSGSVYGDEGYAVFLMDADGRSQTNISNRRDTATPYDNEPDWQPLAALANDPPPSVLGLSATLYRVPLGQSKLQVIVNRNGNLNQTVSCAYKIQLDGRTYKDLPSGVVSFTPGETSKTIELNFSVSSYETCYVQLHSNSGNATFVGGIKNALISAESTAVIDYPDFFVRQHYEDFLNRDPDEPGWRFWNVKLYAQCYAGFTSRSPCNQTGAEVSAAFFLSTEFQETGYLVYRTYKAAYGNLPAAPVPIRVGDFLTDTQQVGQGVVVGQTGWEQALETNKEKFFADFVQRSQFALAYPTWMTPVQFVDALFANAGLIPSALERESAIGDFNGAGSSADNAARARVLRRVAENPTLAQQEFNRAFVLMQYFGYLRRNPNDPPDSDFSGYNFWLTKLNQFNGDYQKSEMVKAFISSTEYRQRFGP